VLISRLPPGACSLLLGSDGLFDVVSTVSALASAGSGRPRPAVELATHAAAQAEATDNITALVITFKPAAAAAAGAAVVCEAPVGVLALPLVHGGVKRKSGSDSVLAPGALLEIAAAG